MELYDKKVALLVEDMYNEFEFWYPRYRLKEAGAEVVVVGSGRTSIFQSKLGMPATSDVGAGDVAATDFDGVVIPGGYAPDIMRRYPKMVQLVKDISVSGKPVAAICHAGWMLCSAGIINGKTVTSFFAIKDDLVNAGAIWVDRAVCIDGNLITSRTPDDLPVFMKEVIKALA